MKTAVLTYVDDNYAENLEYDFLETLRNCAEYKGQIFVIYYGNNDSFVQRISKEYSATVIISEKQFVVSNQRNIELSKVISGLDKEIEKVMCIDGGDVWFQKPVDEIFENCGNTYGFVEENEMADQGFNLEVINQIQDKNIRESFLEAVKNRRLIGSGMIVGERKIISELLEKMADLMVEIKQDHFALDQAIFNYIVRTDGRGKSLPAEYDFSLISRIGECEVKNKIFYDNGAKIINVVHNSGGDWRLIKSGRKGIVPVPQFPKKLAGIFWGVSCFFNPAGYDNKIKNYRVFRERTKKQGLQLLTVELAIGEKPFELKEGDADKLIQIRGDSALWQKERLLNIGINNLPDDCDKFAWLDADIIFCNDNWIKETSDLLEKYALVQPFRNLLRMAEGNKFVDPLIAPFGRTLDVEGKKYPSASFVIAQFGTSVLDRTVDIYGAVGIAWAARKEIFQTNGLFDETALPIADLLMAHLFFRGKLNSECFFYINEKIKDSLYKWTDDLSDKIKASIFYANGDVLHLWHGDQKNRSYLEIKNIIENHKFEAEKDVKIGSAGAWELLPERTYLQNKFLNYFLSRKEDVNKENKVSVIIPCYNDGGYLLEAIESVEKCDKDCYEIIIVDDGSTDRRTIELISRLEKRGHRVFHIEHSGQSAARNFGVKNAKYDYLLFLDADNKISPEYILSGAKILSENPSVGVAFGDKKRFGILEDLVAQRFDPSEIIFMNNVDTCAVVRKEAWRSCGGFDEKLNFWEDWEFFINIYTHGWEFCHMQGIAFEYRVKHDSVNAKEKIKEFRVKFLEYVYKKHYNFFIDKWGDMTAGTFIFNKNKEISRLEEFIGALKKDNVNLEETNASLKESLSSLEKFNKTLKEDSQNFQKEKIKLQDDNNKLSAELNGVAFQLNQIVNSKLYKFISSIQYSFNLFFMNKEEKYKIITILGIFLFLWAYIGGFKIMEISPVVYLILSATLLVFFIVLELYLRIQHNIDAKFHGIELKIDGLTSKIEKQFRAGEGEKDNLAAFFSEFLDRS